MLFGGHPPLGVAKDALRKEEANNQVDDGADLCYEEVGGPGMSCYIFGETVV